MGKTVKLYQHLIVLGSEAIAIFKFISVSANRFSHTERTRIISIRPHALIKDILYLKRKKTNHYLLKCDHLGVNLS